MLNARDEILSALPRELLLDLEDRLRAEAMNANNVARGLALNVKRCREAEGQIRFRLQEQGYEEVVELHGGHLLTEGVMLGTELKIFQPFARFQGENVGIILGFATMPEPGKVPPKNMSRAAGVTLNVTLQPDLLADENSPEPTDIFALFLTARDRERAGKIEEIAVGVIGSDYKDFILYESLEDFLGGYGAVPAMTLRADSEASGDQAGLIIKLKTQSAPYIPPEKRVEQQSKRDAEE